MNDALTKDVLEEVISKGILEFCICPGARNAPLVYALANSQHLKLYYWFEERSAAFFALGRSKATGRPIAVITTSGTAVGELLPAVMEAYYTGTPLLLITADRPRRFRGTGAPQTAEQPSIFGCYAPFMQDIETGENCDLSGWSLQNPAHLNVCFEEPKDRDCRTIRMKESFIVNSKKNLTAIHSSATHFTGQMLGRFEEFIHSVRHPVVIIGALESRLREQTIQFLMELKAPFYAEGVSGLREEPRLAAWRLSHVNQAWELSQRYGYPIDGILRLGGIPTTRLWRDIEDKHSQVKVCSLSDQPFSGTSRGGLCRDSLSYFLENRRQLGSYEFASASAWLDYNEISYQRMLELFQEEPQAEASLIHQLSKQLPIDARVYLGNSLPIREWDLAATFEQRQYVLGANRGLNGIDGQISTFLGFSTQEASNWAILGDLTALYDMAGPWILQQLENLKVNIVVVNNGGGKIFSRMFALPEIQNAHHIDFEPLAALWKLEYQRWTAIPMAIEKPASQLIEIRPDEQATGRFWQKMDRLH